MSKVGNQDGGATERAGMATAMLPLALIVGLFFLWGMANNLNDVLIAHFRSALALGDFASGLVQSAFYLGYFCFAVPAALVMRRHGYKRGVLTGLVLFGIGAALFWPAAEVASYPAFLLALFVIASGLAFLETAANPLVVMLGSPAGAARRLNLAQAFNPLGSIAGVELGRHLILADARSDAASELSSVQLPYLAIAALVLIWALLVASVRFPAAATQAELPDHAGADSAQYPSLLRNSRFMGAVAAQFCYVGAQVGIWSYLIRYAQVMMPAIDAASAAGFVSVSLALFAVGRLAGAYLLGRVSPWRLLAAFGGINAVLCLGAFAWGGEAGVWMLVASSFFMSIMYPTIFVLGIEGLGPLAKSGASLLVMAIIGGAAITALMGFVSDWVSIAAAMLVPAGSFIAICLFGVSRRSRLVAESEGRPE